MSHSYSSSSASASAHNRALRENGVCRGSMWKQNEKEKDKLFCYCVLLGTHLVSYVDYPSYLRGDHPLAFQKVVGASAWHGHNGTLRDCFRVVTHKGLHMYCTAPSTADCHVWLSAIQEGLEATYNSIPSSSPTNSKRNSPTILSNTSNMNGNVDEAKDAPLPQYPTLPYYDPLRLPEKKFRRPGFFMRSSSKEDNHIGPGSSNGTSSQKKRKQPSNCESCGRKAEIITCATPLVQYASENRCFVCPECLVSQGVWMDIFTRVQLYATLSHQNSAMEEARKLCFSVIREHSSSKNMLTLEQEEAAQNDVLAPCSSNENGLDCNFQTVGQANALRDLISSPEFGSYRRLCPKLDYHCSSLELGHLAPSEFVEIVLENTSGKQRIALKKQALDVAGDMGSAMKLLSEYANHGDVELFAHVLQFFLEVIQTSDEDPFPAASATGNNLSAVAFFWPQLQALHLQMLPPIDTEQLQRVELMEDFLLTVSTQCSIQLALELVWGYVADLEDSLFHTSCPSNIRRRRFSVLRFVCELESLLFDFADGWGGGSVSLRNMLTPSPHQVDLLKTSFGELTFFRKWHDVFLSTASSRRDKLLHTKFTRPPEEAAQMALKAARDADYFSSHLSFCRRICDVAYKLFYVDVEQRKASLEHELTVLNASGSMGGDPLNRIQPNSLMRVVRIPTTEGHVFRSKERTPLLLLMEVVQDMDEEEEERNRKQNDAEKQSDDDSDLIKNGLAFVPSNNAGGGPTEEEAESLRSCNYAVDLELPVSEDEPRADEVVGQKDDKKDANVDASTEASSASVADLGKNNHVKAAVNNDESMSSLAHSSPRALARFNKVEDEQLEKSVSKMQMEKLVTEVMISQIQVPELREQDEQHQEEEESKQGTVTDSTSTTANSTAPTVETSTINSSAANGSTSTGSRQQATGISPSNRRLMGDIGACTVYKSNADIRREVLTTIMTKGLRKDHTIAVGAAMAAQKKLQELDRKRAVKALLTDDDNTASESQDNDHTDSTIGDDDDDERLPEAAELQRQRLREELSTFEEEKESSKSAEEDEVMEALRLLLIQLQVGNKAGNNNRSNKVSSDYYSKRSSVRNLNAPMSGETIDKSEIIEIDAGDVDPRLAGCGSLPPAVLSALTLWKGGVVNTTELLELVKKDVQYTQQAENKTESNQENSAFWSRFAFGERWAEKRARLSASSPLGNDPGWDLVGVIVKANDDLRQEAFVMQLINLCREAFLLSGLDLWVQPYKILATGRTTGIIECVRNAMSFDALKKRPGYGKKGLKGHLERMAEYSPNPTEAFDSMLHNFVKSLASYSLMSYFFMFKDRHNGNILLDTAGHVIHIDFGFVFGVAPGGSFSLELSTPFKITEEMLEVMGGMQSPYFSEFVTLFCCGFLAMQAHMDTFLTLVEITCNGSSFKCFEGGDPNEIVARVRSRFCPELSKEQTVAFALDLIKQATQSYGTKQYDYFQYLSQGIAA